jgi:hypothetical protein
MTAQEAIATAFHSYKHVRTKELPNPFSFLTSFLFLFAAGALLASLKKHIPFPAGASNYRLCRNACSLPNTFAHQTRNFFSCSIFTYNFV